jgi:hypothetical protein
MPKEECPREKSSAIETRIALAKFCSKLEDLSVS